MLSAGGPAPSFRMKDQSDEIATPEEYAGKWVVLWWYPKAATPG